MKKEMSWKKLCLVAFGLWLAVVTLGAIAIPNAPLQRFRDGLLADFFYRIDGAFGFYTADVADAITSTSGATSSNTANAIVRRGASGEFSAGVMTGSLDGNASTATSATSATNAANIGITDDTSTNATMYLCWATAATGNLPAKVSSSKLYFNPSTGLLTATGFSGPLTGNVTGNASGSSGSCAGNSATATTSTNLSGGNSTTLLGSLPYQSDTDTTTLLAPNAAASKKYLAMTGDGTNGAAPVWDAIAGGGDVSKVGTPADNQVGVWTGDGTIEGTAGLTYDGANLLMTGDIGKTATRITKGWFTDLEVTNDMAGDITGNAATATAAGKSTNMAGGNNTTLLGSIPYQSNVDVTTLLAPNVTTTKKFLSQTGDATNGAAPQWDAVTKTDVGLGNVENTALSTWAGTANITTLGTVTTGTLSTGAVIGGVTMTLGSDADLDMYYRSSNILSRLAKGTANQVLSMNSDATAIAWADLGGGASSFITLTDVSATAPDNLDDNFKTIVQFYDDAFGGMDSYTKLMLHMDGDDEGTTFTDSSTSAHTMSAQGNANTETSQKKFGTASLELDGTGDYVSTPDSDDFNVGSGDATIACWIYPTGVVGYQTIFAQQSQVDAGTAPWVLMLDNNHLQVLTSTNGTSFSVNQVGSIAISATVWTHVECTISSGTVRTFINGVKDVEASGAGTLYDSSNPATVGYFSSSYTRYFGGYIDDFKFDKGVARHTSNFSVPSAAYSTAAATANFKSADNPAYTGWYRFPVAFLRSSDSQFTVTDSATMQEMLKVGRPVRYADTVGTWSYGIVTAYSSGTVTLAGAPMTTSFDAYLEFGDMGKAVQTDFFISGTYGNGTGDLLAADMSTYFKWTFGKAYLVAFSCAQKTVDTGTEPKINVTVNAAAVSTNDTNLGVQLGATATWVDNAAVAVNTSNYDINRGEAVEINCTAAGGTGDAADLTVTTTFIME